MIVNERRTKVGIALSFPVIGHGVLGNTLGLTEAVGRVLGLPALGMTLLAFIYLIGITPASNILPGVTKTRTNLHFEMDMARASRHTGDCSPLRQRRFRDPEVAQRPIRKPG